MRALALSLILFPFSAYAGPYLELGLSKADGASCITSGRQMGCSESPLGSVALGYTYRGFSLEVEHYSSLTDGRDYGLNLFSLKYRFGK